MSKADIYYSSNMDYTNMADEDLFKLIKSDSKCALEYLINRYKNLVNYDLLDYSLLYQNYILSPQYP